MTTMLEASRLHRIESVAPSTPSREALRIMEDHDLSYLPVAEPEGRCLGVVLRRGLEFGCARMRHDADCPVQVHIKEEVSRLALGDREDWGAVEVSGPAVVLDDAGRPLGILVSR